MTQKPVVLKAVTLPADTEAALRAAFDVLDYPKDIEARRLFLQEQGARIQGIALHNEIIDAPALAQMPNLQIIASYSAGLDNVDVATAKARGIDIRNSSHVLAGDVADVTLGLAIALTRQLLKADAFVRSGAWEREGAFALQPSLGAMRVGVVGLGTIGKAVAERFALLGAKIAYFGRSAKAVPYAFYDDLERMATDCDMLVVTCALSDETHHLISARVLAALGRDGFLINVARGAVVDEAALCEVISADGLAGAALDVLEFEPKVPKALRISERVLFSPHLGSGTLQTRKAMAEHVVDALKAHFR